MVLKVTQFVILNFCSENSTTKLKAIANIYTMSTIIQLLQNAIGVLDAKKWLFLIRVDLVIKSIKIYKKNSN